MVHLETSCLTHSKFFTTMIPDILPLFRARFRIFLMDFVLQILFRPRFKAILSLFHTRFWIFSQIDSLPVCPREV